MTVATICAAYAIFILSLTRLVHVLRAQEHRMIESQSEGDPVPAPTMAGNSKATA